MSPIPLRILLLHGYTQSGPLFSAKSSSLRKSLQKAFPSPTYSLHLSYPSGPIPLFPEDIPGYDPSNHTLPESEPEAFGWWRRKDPSETGSPHIVYQGLEKGLERIAETIRAEGPFDGVIGFSQGACAAGIVASLLEPGRREEGFERACERSGQNENLNVEAGVGMEFPASFLAKGGEGEGGIVQEPLKFAVIYSGFRAPGPVHEGFYTPKIRTPTCHVIGSLDTVVSEERSRMLVEACEEVGRRELVHPGGHFLPGGKVWVEGVMGFIKECMEGRIGVDGGGGGKEERVEDMEVPF